MPNLEATPFDVAEMLSDPAVIAEFINQSYDVDDFDGYLAAFSTSIRAVGRRQVSEATGITETKILEIFNPGGEPTLAQTMKVVQSLGLRLSVRKIDDGSRTADY